MRVMEQREGILSNVGTSAGQPASFVIRLWLEQSPEGVEWRGHVTHVQGQSEAYFRDFRMLLEFLLRHGGVEVPLRAGGACGGAAPTVK